MKNLLFGATILVAFLIEGCQPNEVVYDDHYLGTETIPHDWHEPLAVGEDVIICEEGGTDCDLGWIKNKLKDGTVQWYISNNRGINTAGELLEGSLEWHVIQLRNYHLAGNAKDYFKNEKWEKLFPAISQNESLKNLIDHQNFDLIFPKGDGSVVFVKNKAEGLSKSNVLFAFKYNKICLTNYLKIYKSRCQCVPAFYNVEIHNLK